MAFFMDPQHPNMYIYNTALSAHRAGINVIPVCADGSKRPALAGWRIYQERRVTLEELAQWLRGSVRGLAVVTGEISGNLEALDIDSPETYQAWLARIREDSRLRALSKRIANGYMDTNPAG